jgi:hypothetical protein
VLTAVLIDGMLEHAAMKAINRTMAAVRPSPGGLIGILSMVEVAARFAAP